MECNKGFFVAHLVSLLFLHPPINSKQARKLVEKRNPPCGSSAAPRSFLLGTFWDDLLMATRNPANKNQLSLVVYPISYKALDIPGGFLAGFLVAINSSFWGVLRPIPPQDGIARDHQDI